MDVIEEAIHRQILQAHPNLGSKHATPASRRVDLHYIKMRIFDRWTWERFRRLANLLNLTPYELASVVCLPHQHVAAWRVKTTMPLKPSQGAYAVGLALSILEHQMLGQLTNDTIANPFPDLNKV